MFRNMQNAEIIRKMTEEFDEVMHQSCHWSDEGREGGYRLMCVLMYVKDNCVTTADYKKGFINKS